MNNKKIILSCILTLVLCASLIVGGTFALFTSESNTNIAVTSGKVEVVATIENLTLHSPKLIATNGNVIDDTNVATDKLFSNGGSASLNGAVLSLEKVTPGDRANFQIKITNNSNVAIKYRTVIRTVSDNGLVGGLNMQIGTSYDGSTQYTNWTLLSTAGTTELLDCFVELPTTAGNVYQDKSCSIVFTVEAVQANTQTDNNVAKIGDTYYETLEGAINAVQSGETVEIVRPGTYAPFEIPQTKSNVRVVGIIGKEKASSTIIRNTASQNIKAYGDGTTLESLYIESPVAQTGISDYVHKGAVDPYYSTDSGLVAKDLTITKCHLVGTSEVGNALMYCSTGLTFTHNVVEGFACAISVMNDGTKADSFTITNNTFVGVVDIVDGYWGGQADAKCGDVVIANNEIKDVDMAYITVWDYAQNANDYSAFSNVQITGNNGNITYILPHFNYKVKTSHTVTLGNEGTQAIVYQSKVAFDVEFAKCADYEIKTVDGSEWSSRYGKNFLNQNIDGKAGVYVLATGSYILYEKSTDTEIPFEVVDPTVGKQQIVEMPTVSNVGTVEDLEAMMLAASQQSNGDLIINITSDIDAGNSWTAYSPEGYNGVNQIIINGGGYTISNLNEPLMVGAFGGAGSITINDLTIANSYIEHDNYNGLGLGAFVVYSDASGSITLNNCHLVDTDVICTNGYAGGLVGYVSSGSFIANNCTVRRVNKETMTISGHKSAGGILGHSNANVVIDGCTVEGVTISECLPGRDSAGAATLVGRLSGGFTLTLKGTITTKDNTLNNPGGAPGNIYTALGTTDTTEATLVTE